MEGKLHPSPPHTLAGAHNTTRLAVVIFTWESVFSLRFQIYLDEKFDRGGAKMS